MLARLWLLLVVMLPACASESNGSPTAAAGPIDPLISDAGACGVTTGYFAPASANHVPGDTPLVFASNPPCGGDHFSSWAPWGAHATVVPRGNWIHNLEHGGVAFLYRCASRAACPELAAQVEALAQSLPADPSCVLPVRNRIIVTADPDLPAGVQVAAASWGYTLVARCFDAAAMREFYSRRIARAPENTCAQGFELSGPDAGEPDVGGMDARAD